MKKLHNGDVVGQERIGRNGDHEGNRAFVSVGPVWKLTHWTQRRDNPPIKHLSLVL